MHGCKVVVYPGKILLTMLHSSYKHLKAQKARSLLPVLSSQCGCGCNERILVHNQKSVERYIQVCYTEKEISRLPRN